MYIAVVGHSADVKLTDRGEKRSWCTVCYNYNTGTNR